MRNGYRVVLSAMLLAAGVTAGAALAGSTASAETTVTYRPLSAYEGFGLTAEQQAAEEAQFEEEEALRQELISECMAERGYEYSPRAVSILVTDDVSESELMVLLEDPDAAYLTCVFLRLNASNTTWLSPATSGIHQRIRRMRRVGRSCRSRTRSAGHDRTIIHRRAP